MSNDIKAAVSAATLQLLQPLARFLLEARIGIGELHALARLAYVQAAAHGEAGLGSARANVSRIATRTGLTRVDVAAILAEQRGVAPRARRGGVRAERVLFGWWNDPHFQDRNGAPERLRLKGARRSFASLVRHYSGDANNTAPILDELLRAKAVQEHSDGTLQALKRTCVSVSWDPEGIAALGEEVAEHFETLLHNLRHPEQPRFAQRIVCGHLDAQMARVVIPELTEHAEIFLEGAQEVLNHREPAGGTKHPGKTLRFAVALQFFQEPAAPATSSTRLKPRHAATPATKPRGAQRKLGTL